MMGSGASSSWGSNTTQPVDTTRQRTNKLTHKTVQCVIFSGDLWRGDSKSPYRYYKQNFHDNIKLRQGAISITVSPIRIHISEAVRNIAIHAQTVVNEASNSLLSAGYGSSPLSSSPPSPVPPGITCVGGGGETAPHPPPPTRPPPSRLPVTVLEASRLRKDIA